MQVNVIIPALNEAGNIAQLVQEAAAQPVERVIVVDNGSTDGTGPLAAEAGAQVVVEARRGYGYACAAGAAAATGDILVFLDGDFSSLPAEMPQLLAPIQQGQAALVLGSRTLGEILPGAMPAHQRFGNLLTSGLMRPPVWGAGHRSGAVPCDPPGAAAGVAYAGDDLRLAHRDDGKMRPAGRADSGDAGQLCAPAFRTVEGQRYVARLHPGRLLYSRRDAALCLHIRL